MVKFDKPIYIKPDKSSTDIITFGKSEEQTQSDSEEGLARFGGVLRSPSYLHAYLRSAKILVDEAIRTETLDELALPIFYIQRHTTELLLKRLLSWVYNISEQREKLGEPCLGIPSSKQLKNFNERHTLTTLLNDLEEVSTAYGFLKPPASVCELVDLLSECELTETWSRYSSSKRKEGRLNHVQDEHVVPIKEIMGALELAVSNCVYDELDNKAVYEYPMYEVWLSKARESGDAG